MFIISSTPTFTIFVQRGSKVTYLADETKIPNLIINVRKYHLRISLRGYQEDEDTQDNNGDGRGQGEMNARHVTVQISQQGWLINRQRPQAMKNQIPAIERRKKTFHPLKLIIKLSSFQSGSIADLLIYFISTFSTF